MRAIPIGQKCMSDCMKFATVIVNNEYYCDECYTKITDAKEVVVQWTERRTYKLPSLTPFTSSYELQAWIMDNLCKGMIIESDSFDFEIIEVEK